LSKAKERSPYGETIFLKKNNQTVYNFRVSVRGENNEIYHFVNYTSAQKKAEQQLAETNTKCKPFEASTQVALIETDKR
jgi:hypothetical protein